MSDDTIYRQAAIDALMCLVKQHECDLMPDLLHWTGVKAMLESLPAAQPEIIRCKDCKHRDAEDGFCKGRGWPMQLVPEDGFCDKGERRSEDE